MIRLNIAPDPVADPIEPSSRAVDEEHGTPMSDDGSEREWTWSQEGVEHRIRAMAPADALFTVERYNGQVRDRSKHLDPPRCLHDLSPRAAEEVTGRVAALFDSATSWGQRYWIERMRADGRGPTAEGEARIMADMAARHPGFSTESLTEIYQMGIMLAR